MGGLYLIERSLRAPNSCKISRMKFLDSARLGRNDWWRYLLGLGLITFATIFIGGVPLAASVIYVTTDSNPATDVNLTNGGLIGISPAISLAVTLAPFVMAFIALLVVVRVIHGRPAASLVTAPGRPIRWGRLAQGFGAWLAAGALITLVDRKSTRLNSSHSQISYAVF